MWCGAQLFYFTIDGGRARNPSQSVVAFDGDVVFLDQGAMYSSLLENSPNVAFKVQAPNVNLSYSIIANSARWGIWTDSAVTTSFIAYDNTFVDTGAKAVSFGGTNGYIGFNQFYGNHRACPFGSNGGQLLVTQYSNAIRVDHNTIADGPAFCDPPQSQYWADGLELYGSNLIVSDNTVVNNGGHGIQLGGVQTALIVDVYTNASIAQNNRRDGKFSGIWVGTAVSENSNIQIASLNVGGRPVFGDNFSGQLSRF